jgi:hypothetical protein
MMLFWCFTVPVFIIAPVILGVLLSIRVVDITEKVDKFLDK